MGISLSIISGKGGCGKTTLALSLSQMLSRADISVLLVDCDMSTHGATYFFENLLNDKEKIATVYDLFLKNSNSVFRGKRVLKVQKNFDFIPSCVSLATDLENEYDYRLDMTVINSALKKYDVVIFDCQAGCTQLTKEITKISSENLIVMEVDAITSSSTRVLISQLGFQLDSANTYQVFNKMTAEDFKVYSLVTHGTFYTNLTPIQYDLSIRKAFATNELPSIEVENTIFSNNIYKLAYALFKQSRDRLDMYIVEYKKRLLDNLELELKCIKKQRTVSFINMLAKVAYDIAVVVFIIILFIFSFSSTNFEGKLILDDDINSIWGLTLYLLCITEGSRIFVSLRKYFKKDKIVYDENINKLVDEIEDLKNHIDSYYWRKS